MIDIPILAKDALREGDTKKEYRFIVYQTDGETVDFTIDNDTLVYESVKFDERMCSDTNLKFGLCEGTSLEFQAFNIPNITGRRIQAFVDVNYGSNQVCTIPMGWFTVNETSRQASTGILKITAYNKLQSTYLDAKANDIIAKEFSFTDKVYVHDIIALLLKEYAIIPYEQTDTPASYVSESMQSRSASYRYNTGYEIYYNQGVFSPSYILRSFNVSTSTNIYFEGVVQRRVYDLSSLEDKPVKIRFDVDMDVVDQNIYDAIEVELNRFHTNVTAAEHMTRILNMYGLDESMADIPTFFPTVYIVFRGGATRSYGYNLYERLHGGSGTFSDLSKITLLHVSKIYFNYPLSLYFGGLVSGNVPVVTDTAHGIEVRNRMRMFGANQTYLYYADSQQQAVDNPYSDICVTPKLPDGSDIPQNGLVNYVHASQIDGLTDFDFTEIPLENLADVTLRDLQTAVYEQQCLFGQLDRETDMFTGVALNHNRLFPAETLYPADTLYPTSTSGDGQAERANKSMYSKLWADEGNIRTFRNLSLTYKGTEEDPDTGNISEVEKEYTTVINANGTDDYTSTNNWIFKNLVWDDADIEIYASEMVSKMQDVTWFPFEMWCAGLPYVETGDEVEINLGEETYISYVLRRTLKGIQNLQDEMINGTLDIF